MIVNPNFDHDEYASALLQVPSFPVPVPDPVRCNLPFTNPACKRELVERYRSHGFAVAQFPGGSNPEEVLLYLSSEFGMGEPFVPPLYTQGSYRAPPLSRIAIEGGVNGNSKNTHPSFQRSEDLPLHCDGTLQPIGMVRNSTLYCSAIAETGGETVLFNSTGAFVELFRQDAPAALSLFAHDVLIRTANMNGSNEKAVGPAFGIGNGNGRLVSRYSTANTDSWVSGGDASAELRRALTFLENASGNWDMPSRYVTTFKLIPDQVILMDNTQLAHGRKAYQNSAMAIRTLHRGLFLHHPEVVE